MIMIRSLSLWGSCLVFMASLGGCGGSESNDTSASVEAKAAPASASRCVGTSLLQGASCFSFQQRESVLYKPTGDIQGIALLLHGAPGHANKVMQLFDGAMLSSKESWLVVAPQGSGGIWGWKSFNNDNDNGDVTYISGLLDELRAQHNISSDKVYIFGYSAGGFMGYKLACQIPEQLTAVISLAGQYRGNLEHCSTSTSVSLHHFHSPSDSDVPMGGRSSGGIISVDETLAHWRVKNGCDQGGVEIDHPGVTATSSGTVTTEWNNCLKPVKFSSMGNVKHEDNYQAEELYEIYKTSL
jgi:polyhydroxybutyrate depolymerase